MVARLQLFNQLVSMEYAYYEIEAMAALAGRKEKNSWGPTTAGPPPTHRAL
jgi:hypothetical protein